MRRQDLFTQCLLRAYYQRRGSATPRRRISELVHDQIKNILTQEDYEVIPSGNSNNESDIRWQKDADWCHTKLKNAGLIERVSHGVWRLTPKGVEEAEKVIGSTD
jgi:restriction endonuclease Mrr